MTYAKLHENLPEGWWSQTNIARENFRELPITSSTIAVKLGLHGVIMATHISSLRNSVVQHRSVLKPLHVNIINLIAQSEKVVIPVKLVQLAFCNISSNWPPLVNMLVPLIITIVVVVVIIIIIIIIITNSVA
jgi:hypothetical protein